MRVKRLFYILYVMRSVYSSRLVAVGSEILQEPPLYYFFCIDCSRNRAPFMAG